MLKATLRREFLKKRKEYSLDEVNSRSKIICRNFFDFYLVNNLKIIHTFLPIVSSNEVNTWFIIEHLRVNFPEIKLSVPLTDLQAQTLSHYLLTPETILLQNKWGIPEPQNAELVPVQNIDMVFVPLLAFDKQGHRVGYGKGFYDRFLAECRPDTITIGLSLEEEPVPFISDVHNEDITLQFVITPASIYQFPLS
ncbi:5-formyltetrahydrofolate cyclo-ligase [Adhaeribacter radiodurans]|uniref:5-formyltetrahydrofolate cyclo-ligase n=1 Tax=Adhaeribacter radiodurans TaxID=2745197 RepID=A0A7L7L3A6_9BACT|nr:5-formyltetrahydrofolate cyclo-ligase [Adhaeribacter radiodurans]QMU27274.1 5-formyltetrahydrofolate cyclo-ligase [Adhaeribacter radiodurans]